MLAARPNKQRWANWMMGVFLSRLLVSDCAWAPRSRLSASVGRVSSLYVFPYFLRVFCFVRALVCAVCVCVCAFVFSWVSWKVFHDIPANFSCNCDRSAWEHNYRDLLRNIFKKVAIARPHQCGRKAVAYKILRGKQSVKTVSRYMVMDVYVLSHWFGSSVWSMFFP